MFLGFGTGLSGASIGGGHRSLGQLSKETSQMFKDVAGTMTKPQEQSDSLAALALHNRRAWGLPQQPNGDLSAPQEE